MARFYFMTSHILPVSRDVVAGENWSLEPRRWDVRIFSWAALQTNHSHKVSVPYQLADFLAQSIQFEFVTEADDLEQAKDRYRDLYAALLLEGLSPFTSPFVSSNSINDISGIEVPGRLEADGDPRAPMARAIHDGTEVVTLGWNDPPMRQVQTYRGATRQIDKDLFLRADMASVRIAELSRSEPALAMLRDAIISVHQVTDVKQSILHIWTVIEALFPAVNSELNFRMALYIAQLTEHDGDRKTRFEAVKAAYGIRSKIAHGDGKKRSDDFWAQGWIDAWGILTSIMSAILERGKLPSEQELIDELLAT